MSLDVLTVTLNAAIDWTVSVPNFSIGEVNRVASEMTGAGGKGINVAAVLADYGLAVAATGFIGRDNEEPFCQLFERRQIEDRMVRLDGPTRMGIKIVSGVGGETTDVNFPGLAPTPRDLEALESELERTQAQWVVLAGSVPPGVEPRIYRDLIGKLKSRGRKVALDASGVALQAALEAPSALLPNLIKPNLAELEEWTGAKLKSPDAILEAAQELVERGIEQVAVSMGSDGMLLAWREGVLWATPPPIEVGSTVGAGDALVAGLVAASIRGLSPGESVRLATAFAVDVLMKSTYALSPVAVASWSRRVTICSIPWERDSLRATALTKESAADRRTFTPNISHAERAM